MSEHLRRVLDPRTDDFEIRQRLHGVPPHVVYEITYEGRRAVCKLSQATRGATSVEGRVLRYVDQETSIPVPSILAVGPDYFVAEYRDDAPEEFSDDEKHVDEAWLRAAGGALAQLHREATFDQSGLLAVDGDPNDAHAGLRVDSIPGTTWSTALNDLFGVYQDNLSGTRYEAVVKDARDFLRTYSERFDPADERDPVLLHGWFSPDHVAVDEDVTCVIDFEHALVGSEEWDYWRAMVPLHSEPWDSPAQTRQLFKEGYESVRPLPSGLETRGRAYQAFVSVSYLDSLQTQRGIDDETRSTAEFLQRHVSKTLAELREDWVN